MPLLHSFHIPWKPRPSKIIGISGPVTPPSQTDQRTLRLLSGIAPSGLSVLSSSVQSHASPERFKMTVYLLLRSAHPIHIHYYFLPSLTRDKQTPLYCQVIALSPRLLHPPFHFFAASSPVILSLLSAPFKLVQPPCPPLLPFVVPSSPHPFSFKYPSTI